MMKIYSFLGLPGSGKGTFAKLMSHKLKLKHISIGDLMREEIKQESHIGKSIKHSMENGLLVHDNIVHEVCVAAMKAVDKGVWSGIILDGYPRTTVQAKLLDEHIKNEGVKSFQSPIAVNIILEKWVAVDKLLGRVHCDKCNTGYNTCSILTNGYHMPAILPTSKSCIEMKLNNSLTTCSQSFVRRNDDTKETISKRLDEYYDKTEPVLTYYRHCDPARDSRLKEFQVTKGVDDLDALIACMLK